MHISVRNLRRIILALSAALVIALALLIAAVTGTLTERRADTTTHTPDPASVPAPPEPTSTNSPYLSDEEAVMPERELPGDPPVLLPVLPVLFEYVEVTGGCNYDFSGECLRVYSGPGTDHEVRRELRNGIVLKVDGKVRRGTSTWYKVVFDEWLRYPERLELPWYVNADGVEILLDEGDRTSWEDGVGSTSKQIVVDRSEQRLRAFEPDGTLFLETAISTGLALTPTPRGTFTIFKKTPSRYMQGPLPNLPSDQRYDLPGVPWNLYFTHGGAVIHGTYWHDSFGDPYSHGCVNLDPAIARQLYSWAELGTEVVVRD